MLVKTLKRAGLGFIIGVFVGDLIAILKGTSTTGAITIASKQLLEMAGGSPVISMLLQSLFSGLYGAVCFAGMSFYDTDRLPLAAATALHCALIVLLFIHISILLGWVSTVIETLFIAGCQIVGFFIIWLIMYLAFKKQVRELNELMDKKQDKTES
jgi:hypothetical protein